MTSRRPYWCPKTMKRRPCWCPKPILWELNSFLMQTLSFVPINLHRCWPREWKHSMKPRANGRNIVGQQLPTMLEVTCCVRLHTLLHVVGCCCAKFETGQAYKPTSPNFSSVLWSQKRSATMLDRLHSSSNIVGAAHAHYACITKTYRLYSSNDALQVPTLLGVVASVCTPLPARTQQLSTLLAQQCWELLRPFARSLRDEILKDVSCLNLYKFVTF